MRILVLALVAILGAVLLPVGPVVADPGAGPAAVVVAADGSDAPQPGTDAESRDYEQREARSPEAGQFVGGFHGVFALLVLAALVLLVVFLAREI